MAKILIYDIAADSGGALSVLNSYYQKAKIDKRNSYIFIISLPKLETQKNIDIIRFPWTKKSWLHRLYFDFMVAPRIISRLGIGRIISLQNTIIPFVRLPQDIYMHQSLPFSSYKFNIFTNTTLWIYQNIISHIIYYSLKRARHITVQTKWVAKKIEANLGIDSSMVTVEAPRLPDDILKYKYSANGKNQFIFPAAPHAYKNHMLIIDSLRRLPASKLKKLSVIFTFNCDENKYSRRIKRIVDINKLPVKFYIMSRSDLFKCYEESTLLFPSLIESYGLPLAEARAIGSPIIASDTEFSLELMSGYKDCRIIKDNSVESLQRIIDERIR